MTQPEQRGSWYQRMFARSLASEEPERRRLLDARKRALFAGLSGDVLEIGPGTGTNLRFYGADVRWRGVEPNPAMFPYLEEEAARLGMTIALEQGAAERLPVADASFDAVVATHVLCSVRDPALALREIRRVLKPGGRFVFLEHVAADERGARWRQRLISPLWRPICAGCHPDRETGALIEAAGFSQVDLARFRLNLPIVGPHIDGAAVR